MGTENNAEKARRAASLTQRGVELFFRGHYAEALGFIDRAIALAPDFARAYAAKAVCCAQMGEPRAGVELAEKALALEPDFAVAYTIRGLCRGRLKDHERAVADYLTAVKLVPDDFRVYYNFACYWAECGEEELCREYLEHAFALTDAGFGDVAVLDPDLARYSGAAWFRELLANLKRRAAGARGEDEGEDKR